MHILLVNLVLITEKFDISHVVFPPHKLNIVNLLVKENISEPDLHNIGIKKWGIRTYSACSHISTLYTSAKSYKILLQGYQI